MNVAGADQSGQWHGLLPLRNLFRRQELFRFRIEDVVFCKVRNGLIGIQELRVSQLQRRKDVLGDELLKCLAADFLDDQREQGIVSVAVFETLAGLERDRWFELYQILEH